MFDVESLSLHDESEHGYMHFDSMELSDDWQAEEQARRSAFASVGPNTYRIDKSWKKKFRNGVPNTQRRKFWLIASGGLDLINKIGYDFDTIKEVSDTDENLESYFGLPKETLSFLPSPYVERLEAFLRIVWHQNKTLRYAPLMASVAAILLLYMEPSLAYYSIQAMINRSLSDKWYFKGTKNSFEATMEAVELLVSKRRHRLYEHMKRLKLNIASLSLFLFSTCFMPVFILPVMLTVFDSFILEGRKVLVRVCVTAFEICEEELLKAGTEDEMIKVFMAKLHSLVTVSETKHLVNASFRIRLSRRRDIEPLEKKYLHMETKIDSTVANKEMINCSKTPLPVDLETTLASMTHLGSLTSSQTFSSARGALLDDEMISVIWSNLPVHAHRYTPVLKFAMQLDGTVISAIFSQTSYDSMYILVVKTETSTFGAVLSDALVPQMAKERYTGGPATFVFSVTERKAYKRYPRVNEMFFSATAKTITVGGPHPAIYIEDGFHRVLSQPCETFGSPAFVPHETGVPVLDLELYRLLIHE